ncbi:MAG TPA: trypsin-like peptidase domain-containing protein [Lactovum miscens]|uniref:S1C family serine protease n=1 Tax=Lactovum miscens TaxID=190387 RepID=UPI002EDA4612
MAKSSWVKYFLSSVAGGVIALSGGVAYQQIQGGLINNSSTGTSKVITTATQVTTDSTTAIAKIQNAVVSVLNYQTPSTSSNSNSIYDQFFGSSNTNSNSNSDTTTPQLTSEGSGVIYKKDGNDAYLVTNYHVVSGSNQLKVQLSDGITVAATLVGTDPTKDLAVIKISSADVTTVASFADSSKLTVGEPAIAIGSPNGVQFANSATEGIVSAVNRSVVYNPSEDNTSNVTSNINAIQTDAAINPGNSGGPLVNIKGQIIGINSSKLATTSDGTTALEGMGFSIPSNDVVNVLNKIENNKKTVALGISMQDLTDLDTTTLSKLNLPSTVVNGVYVAQVTDGFPATLAGIKAGDVITQIDNTSISTGAALSSQLLNYNVGDTAKITLYRDGKAQTVSVHFTKDSSQLKATN